MNRIKLISFEMKMEFDIGDTEYNVVWSLDNNMEDVEHSLDIIDTEKETGSTIKDEIKEENVFEESFEDFKSVEEEETVKEQPAANLNKKEDMEKKAKVEDNDEKEKMFGQHTDLFRESWGLPSDLPAEDIDNSSTEDEASVVISVKQTVEANGQKVEEEVIIPIDEEEAEKSFVFTTEVKMTRGKMKTDDEENIQENDENGEDKENLYKEALTKDESDDKENERSVEGSMENTSLNDIFEDSTSASSEYQTMTEEHTPDKATDDHIMTEEAAPKTATDDHITFICTPCYDHIMAEEDAPETALDDHPRQFTLKLGAGPRSVKLSSKSSGLSGPPVFSQVVEGLEEEQLGDFGKAWAEAVSVCLERRIAAGITLEEVMTGLVEEMGLDKFEDIVEHFLGSLTLTVEQVETEDETQEEECGDDGV